MKAEDFFRIISEFEFICDDIVEIKNRVDLTGPENQKIDQAIVSIEKVRQILTELFPTIESLSEDVRKDLKEELES